MINWMISLSEDGEIMRLFYLGFLIGAIPVAIGRGLHAVIGMIRGTLNQI